jgi:hypothetical protein
MRSLGIETATTLEREARDSANDMWETCECILYGFYKGGKLELAERIKK